MLFICVVLTPCNCENIPCMSHLTDSKCVNGSFECLFVENMNYILFSWDSAATCTVLTGVFVQGAHPPSPRHSWGWTPEALQLKAGWSGDRKWMNQLITSMWLWMPPTQSRQSGQTEHEPSSDEFSKLHICQLPLIGQ